MWNEDLNCNGINSNLDESWLTNMDKFIPHLVWKIVLKNLEVKNDIENCSNASQFFRTLLLEKRHRIVVLPILFGTLGLKYCDEQNIDESYKETTFESIPWKATETLTKPHKMTAFWKCRLVCKSWNQSIETIHRGIDAGHFWMLEDFKSALLSDLRNQFATESFGEETEIRKFCNHFELSHYNSALQKSYKTPFLGQSIEISIIGREEYNEEPYYIDLIDMLQKYGHDIWYFRELYISSEEHYTYWYKKLVEMVQLMPNLKVLRLTWISVATNDLLELEAEIVRNPFPKLPNLKYLATFQVPGTVLNHLVNKNRHIYRLQSVKGNLFNHRACEIFKNNLPNLSHLCFEATSVDDLETFEKYKYTINLLKLNFYWKDQENVPFVPWSRVFNAIQSKLISNTCIELSIQMPEPRTDAQRNLVLNESFSCRLQIASIQHVLVQQSGCRFCIDFMLPFRDSLTEIEVICDTEYIGEEHDDLERKQVIKFLGIEDRMEDSNIATKLPLLKVLKVAGREKRLYIAESNKIRFKENWDY